MLNLYDDNKHYLNPSLPDLSGGGYETVTDSISFMKKMGWSSHYRFNVIVSDINGVKLIAKRDLMPKHRHLIQQAIRLTEECERQNRWI